MLRRFFWDSLTYIIHKHTRWSEQRRDKFCRKAKKLASYWSIRKHRSAASGFKANWLIELDVTRGMRTHYDSAVQLYLLWGLIQQLPQFSYGNVVLPGRSMKDTKSSLSYATLKAEPKKISSFKILWYYEAMSATEFQKRSCARPRKSEESGYVLCVQRCGCYFILISVGQATGRG